MTGATFAAKGAVIRRHNLEALNVDEIAPASHRFVAECGCHNPDGYGEGRMDFAGPSVEDVLEQWYEHVQTELERIGK